MELRLPQRDRRTPKPDGPDRRRRALVTLVLFLAGLVGAAVAEPLSEDEVKAGFLYSFLLFVEWPAKEGDVDDSLTLCVAGESSLRETLSRVEGRWVGGRKLVVSHLDRGAEPESLRSCDLLFIRASLAEETGDILHTLQGYPVLSVGEVEGFALAGGMINFLTRKNSVGFEINRGAAERVGIKLRSKLLRLADGIVEDRSGR